jgi:hypothetical protein
MQPASLDAQTEQRIAQEAEEQRTKDATTLGAKIGAGAVTGTIGALDRFIQNFQFTPDPSYIGKPVEEDIKKAQKAGLDEYLPLFEKAVSHEHFDQLYGEAFAMRSAKEDLGRMSMVGRVGLGFTDPGAVAVGAVALPVEGVGIAGQVVRAGLTGAAQNTVLGVLNKANDPTMGWHELLGEAATGFVMGAAVHGMFAGLRGEHAELSEKLHDAVKPTFGEDTLSAARTAKPGTDSGMDVPERPIPDKAETRLYDAAAEKDIRPAFLGIRRGLSARMAKSKSDLVRYTGRRLFAERVGYTNKNVAVEESAEQMSRRIHEKLSAKWNGALNAAWKDFRKEQGISMFDADAETEFRRSVGRYMRDPSAPDVDPRIAGLVKNVNETTAAMLEEAKRAGVPGAEHIASEPNWLPRLASREGFEDVFQTKKLSFEDVRDQLVIPAIERGLRSKMTEAEAAFLNKDLTAKVGDAWLKRWRDKATLLDTQELHHGLNYADVDSIEALLTEAGVDPDKAAILTESLRKRNDEKATHARFKSRIPMDESFSTEITSRTTGDTHTVSLADLLENDVGHLLERYTRDMSGWVALKRTLGVGTQKELDELRSQVVNEHGRSGGNEKDIGRIFDIGVNTTLGRSTEQNPGGSASRLGRMARDYNQLLYMSQVGFTMVAEVAPTMAYAGLRTSLRAMPGVAKLFKRMQSGEMAEKEARLYAQMYAPGTDWTRNPVYLRTDALGETMWRKEKWWGKALNKADNAQQVLKRAQSALSGMAPLNAFMQVWAARGSMLKLLELAKARKVSQAWVHRLRNHGLTEEAQTAIFGKLKGLKDLDSVADAFPTWDAETREVLSAYMSTVTRRQVVEGMAGDSIEMMHTAAGKPFTQFRRFMTSSYEAHLLNALHMRDWQAFHMVVGSTMLASLGMGARGYLNTIGDPEGREKQLNLKQLVLQGVQQSSYSSVIPMLIDTGREVAGYDPLFAYGRSSGLDSSIKGVPSIATAGRIHDLVMTPGRLLHGEELSKQDVSNVYKLLWLNNLTGFRNVGDWLARQYPSKSQ